MRFVVDYIDGETGKIARKYTDGLEFWARDGVGYFDVGGRTFHVPLDDIIQIFVEK